MKPPRFIISYVLCFSMIQPIPCTAQEPEKPTQSKYKLTVVEGASTMKRAKKGRVSAQAVVKVTDENDVPVAGIAITFLLPQLSGAGATFAGGGMASIVTTNAVGLASSGSFAAVGGSSFSLSVAAAVPGGVISAAIPVNTAALAIGAGAAGGTGAAAGGAAGGAGAGLSAGVIGGIVAGVAGAVVAGVVAATKGGSSSPTQPTTPRGAIGIGSGPVFR